MSEVATNAQSFLMRIPGRTIGSCMLVPERELIVRIIHNGFYPWPARLNLAEEGPRDGCQLLRFAIAAAEQKYQHIIGQLMDRMLPGALGDMIWQAAIRNQKSIPQRQ